MSLLSPPAEPLPTLAEPHANTRFVLIGAGGLGCPVALSLLAAGASRLLILDDDVVDTSNLQRQVLYTVGDVGAPKAEAARHQLRRRAPYADIETAQRRLEVEDAAAFVAQLGPHDILIECTDTPELKFALNDACVARGQRFVVGGVVGWRGQAIAMGASGTGDAPACYRCIFESPPVAAPTCAGVGVIGAAAGHIGALMAQLAWALATDREVSGRLYTVDFRSLETRSLAPAKRPDCEACSSPSTGSTSTHAASA